MQDRHSDHVRTFIAARIEELGLKITTLSERLGKNRGYLNDYLAGSPRDLSYEVKMQLAGLLKIKPEALGVSAYQPAAKTTAPTGLSDDGVAYVPGGDIPVPPSHIALFEMRTRALDEHPERLEPGHILAIDLNVTKPELIAPGRIVIVQLCDKRDLLVTRGTVFREFVPPNKLITNSSGPNTILRLDDPNSEVEPVIKGALSYVIRHATSAWARRASDTPVGLPPPQS